MEIKEINEQELKSNICDTILRQLPDWFGIEDSIIEYVNEVKPMLFFTVFNDEEPIAFLTLKTHNSFAAEIYVMGVLSEYHRKTIGTSLVKYAEAYCIKHGYQYLTVKTVDESVDSLAYEKTRKFYSKVGFVPLEVFPLLWSKENPCLFLVKHLDCMGEQIETKGEKQFV